MWNPFKRSQTDRDMKSMEDFRAMHSINSSVNRHSAYMQSARSMAAMRVAVESTIEKNSNVIDARDRFGTEDEAICFPDTKLQPSHVRILSHVATQAEQQPELFDHEQISKSEI